MAHGQVSAVILAPDDLEHVYWELVGAWARDDSGPFPSRAEAERLAREELVVLCRGLGRWAAVLPLDVFPPVPPPPVAYDEGW